MVQLWMFVVAPIIGGIIAAIVWMSCLHRKDKVAAEIHAARGKYYEENIDT